jgi:hypothetical protein
MRCKKTLSHDALDKLPSGTFPLLFFKRHFKLLSDVREVILPAMNGPDNESCSNKIVFAFNEIVESPMRTLVERSKSY